MFFLEKKAGLQEHQNQNHPKRRTPKDRSSARSLSIPSSLGSEEEIKELEEFTRAEQGLLSQAESGAVGRLGELKMFVYLILSFGFLFFFVSVGQEVFGVPWSET